MANNRNAASGAISAGSGGSAGSGASAGSGGSAGSGAANQVASTDESELCALVRARLKMDSYPVPVDFSQPRYVRTPFLWLVIFERHEVKRDDFISSYGMAGPLAMAFHQALEQMYPFAKRDSLLNLSTQFRAMGLQFLTLKDSLQDMLSLLGPQISTVEREMVKLDSEYLSHHVGSASARAFALTAEFLDPDQYHPAHAAAIRKATNLCSPSTAGEGPAKRQRSASTGEPNSGRSRKKPCRDCGELVTNFRNHNQTCKGSKKK